MGPIKNTQSFGSGNIGCGNATNSYNNNTSITVNNSDDENNQIKQWLSTLEPQHRHQNVQINRVDGVGGWLFEKSEFREWSGSQGVPQKPVLFCYGDPGVGKTNISSLVIDWLCDEVNDREIAVAGLYCDYLAQEEQSTTNMLGAILKQLIERDGIPQFVRQAFRKGKRGFGGRAVKLLDLMKILKTTIESLPEVFICIDGLDECLPKNRQELLEKLQEVIRNVPTTRVFLSGRPHIKDEVGRCFTKAIMIPVIPTTADIKRFLEMRLDRDTIPAAMDDNLRAEIMRVVPEKISQIFLLVSLNIDAVLEEVTIHKRKKKLDEMSQGNGLRDAYSATLGRIKAQTGSKSTLGMQALMWLSHSQESLKANDLCHALGVEIRSTDLNPQNIPAIETLLGCSLGLVIVEASSYTVRLVHYTLKEYLSDNTDLFPTPHAMIAEACLTYLNFQYVRDMPPFVGSPPEAPLLEYASRYWATHARREMTESITSLAVKLLDEFGKHVAFGVLLDRDKNILDGDSHWRYKPDSGGSYRFTGLHGAAYFGIVEIAVSLLKMRTWDLNITDMIGNTALMRAVKMGHGDIVKELLGREDVTPDTPDKDGRTPLSWAAGYGREGLVKALLEREDVTPDTPDKYGRTPLSWAAEHGNESIVKALLEREDVTPDTPDKDGRTPLSWAARSGREGVVKALLEREDVTPDTPDKDGRTPLSWAAEYGRKGLVKALLEREDVTPDTPDKDGRTPFSWAAGYGREGLVKALLEREDVTPDTPDKYGRTPLSWAAGNGREGVVEALLERGDVTPDTADTNGQTPASWAEELGHFRVVEMLQEQRSISEDIIMIDSDLTRQTALPLTSDMKHTGPVPRPLDNQPSAPQPVAGDSSAFSHLMPASHFNDLPEGSGDLGIHDESSSCKEPPRPPHHTTTPPKFTLDLPLLALLLPFLVVLLLTFAS